MHYKIFNNYSDDDMDRLNKNIEFKDLTDQLDYMIKYRSDCKKTKFDLIFKIMNLFLDHEIYKEEKQFLFDTFIYRNISEEIFVVNLCSMLKQIYDKLKNKNKVINMNRQLSKTQSRTVEINQNLHKNNSNKIQLIEKELERNNKNLDFKCLNNHNNVNRNVLILKASRGIPVKPYHNEFDEIFHNFYKFIKPTSPIINCSINNNEYQKYIYKKEESKESKIQSDLNKSEINYEYNLNKFTSNILLEWLSECYLIKQSDIHRTSIEDIIARCCNGVLLADLVNVLEGRVNPVKGIDRTNSSTTKNKLNIGKVLEYLRTKGKINRRFLFDEDKILHGDSSTIIGLLYDLHQFYKGKNLLQPKKILIQNYNDKTGFDKETEDINVHNWLKNKLPDDDAYFERYGNSDIIKDDFLIYDSSSNLDKLSRRLENIHTSKFIKPKDNSKNLYTYGKCTVMTSPKDKQYLTRFQSIHCSGESSKRNQTTRNNNVHSKRNIGLNNDTQFSSIKSINTNNEIFYSQEIPSAGSKILDNHKNEIKSWLSSIGIKFAKDIDFDKPQVEEFRDGLLLLEIISNLDKTNKIIYGINSYPKSKAEALNNIKKALKILEHNKKSIPLYYLNSEEDIYNAETHFIISFLNVLKKSYHLEKEFNDTLLNKQIKNSIMCSSLSNVNSNRHSKAPNSIYLSCNVRSIDYKNPIKVIKANRKDNSQRKFYSPNKLARSIILTHPKYAWN